MLVAFLAPAYFWNDQGYLLEIRADGKLMAWESEIFPGAQTSFVELLAELAWIRE